MPIKYESLPEGYEMPKIAEDAEVPATSSRQYQELPKDYQTPYIEGYGNKAAPSTTAEYAKVPWKEILSSGGANLPAGVYQALKAIPAAVYNYPETMHVLKSAGLGGIGAAREALKGTRFEDVGNKYLYQEKDPQKLAEEKAIFGEMVKPYTAAYKAMQGDQGELKQLVAEDPYAVLSSLPIGGGVGAAGRLIGKTGTLGKVAAAPIRAAGWGIEKVSDPLGSIIGAGQGLGSAAEAIYKRSRKTQTGVGDYPFEMAYKAGALPETAPEKTDFSRFAAGTGESREFSKRLNDAVDAMHADEFNQWKAGKTNLLATFNNPLPYSDVFKAINDYRSTELPHPKFAMGSAQAAHTVLGDIERDLLKRTLPQNAANPVNTLRGFDQLKQELWDRAETSRTPMERNAVLSAYHAVKNTMDQHAPGYSDLMDKYKSYKQGIKDTTALGGSDNIGSNVALARFARHQKTPQGRSLIENVSEYDPSLPYMAAGSALHEPTATGAAAMAQGITTAQAMPGIFGSLAGGRFIPALEGVAGLGGQLAMQSPDIQRGLSYTLGELSSKPVVKGAVGLAKGLVKSEPYVQPLAYQEERARQNVEPLFGEKNPIEVSRATGGRINRGMTSQMLIAAVERAKAEGQKTTESILEQPDEHVVRALKVANENI